MSGPTVNSGFSAGSYTYDPQPSAGNFEPQSAQLNGGTDPLTTQTLQHLSQFHQQVLNRHPDAPQSSTGGTPQGSTGGNPEFEKAMALGQTANAMVRVAKDPALSPEQKQQQIDQLLKTAASRQLYPPTQALGLEMMQVARSPELDAGAKAALIHQLAEGNYARSLSEPQQRFVRQVAQSLLGGGQEGNFADSVSRDDALFFVRHGGERPIPTGVTLQNYVGAGLFDVADRPPRTREDVAQLQQGQWPLFSESKLAQTTPAASGIVAAAAERGGRGTVEALLATGLTADGKVLQQVFWRVAGGDGASRFVGGDGQIYNSAGEAARAGFGREQPPTVVIPKGGVYSLDRNGRIELETAPSVPRAADTALGTPDSADAEPPDDSAPPTTPEATDADRRLDQRPAAQRDAQDNVEHRRALVGHALVEAAREGGPGAMPRERAMVDSMFNRSLGRPFDTLAAELGVVRASDKLGPDAKAALSHALLTSQVAQGLSSEELSRLRAAAPDALERQAAEESRQFEATGQGREGPLPPQGQLRHDSIAHSIGRFLSDPVKQEGIRNILGGIAEICRGFGSHHPFFLRPFPVFCAHRFGPHAFYRELGWRVGDHRSFEGFVDLRGRCYPTLAGLAEGCWRPDFHRIFIPYGGGIEAFQFPGRRFA